MSRDESIHGTTYGAAEQMLCLAVFMKALGDGLLCRQIKIKNFFFLIQVISLDDMCWDCSFKKL